MHALSITIIPGAYFNALLVCFFVLLFKEYGLISNPLRLPKIFWPVLKPLLIGLFPAVAISALLQVFFPSQDYIYVHVLAPLGVLVSAVLLHQYLLTKFRKMAVWHLSIVVLASLQLILLAFFYDEVASNVEAEIKVHLPLTADIALQLIANRPT